jgi:methylated-DNA-[protein]-cysteine S-methyltransferase
VLPGIAFARFDLDGLGAVEVAASADGVRAISFLDWHDPTPNQRPGTGSPSACAAMLARAEAFLRSCAASRRPRRVPPTDLAGLPQFRRDVLAATAAIPWGETRTYGQIAAAIGKFGAARAVGQALGRNPIPVLIPCHRVLGTGWAGGFSPGLAIKRRLLALEGVALA